MHKKEYTKNWFDRCIPVWEKYLKELKGKPNLSFMEIGSYEGRSACWLMENILTGDSPFLVCIDLFEGCVEQGEWSKELYDRYDMSMVYDNFLKNTKQYRVDGTLVCKKGESQKTVRCLHGKQFDFIYIDGSHIASDVLEDIILSFPLLKENGIMIFDDYTWEFFDDPLRHPKMAIDAFLSIFKNQIKVLLKDQQVIIRKL